jgi:soluble lytic murein transglycosylase-like protein
MNGDLKYLGRLVRALGWSIPKPRRHAALFAIVGLMLAGTAGVYANVPSAAEREWSLGYMEQRIKLVSGLFDRAERVYENEVAPIERVLLGYRDDDRQLIRRMAAALVRESRRTNIDPNLLTGILLVENPWLDPGARSIVGAQGLMQVMPLHQGKWKGCAPRLDEIEANICHGASIFASYIAEEKGNVERALLRYNGCVRGTNTPNCRMYPAHVYASAGRASITAAKVRGTMAASR